MVPKRGKGLSDSLAHILAAGPERQQIAERTIAVDGLASSIFRTAASEHPASHLADWKGEEIPVAEVLNEERIVIGANLELLAQIRDALPRSP
jgi:hypothetical protein